MRQRSLFMLISSAIVIEFLIELGKIKVNLKGNADENYLL